LGAFIWVNVFLILGGVIADVHEFAGQLYEHSALISALLACALLTAFLFWYLRNIRRKHSIKGKRK
ncbi:MAG: hypothetical protein WCI43_09195, partial [Candidatus Firestonebacteria bacterium]